MQPQSIQSANFHAIRLRLASSDQIKAWSHGEVIKPETINYRTQKPEKDGLFDERIFGPTKDWECYCGKYKKIRYRGIVCDKCGVEVTRASVRRERMGHIVLASPVCHIWFLKGVPSKIGLALDISVQDLEKVVYFASFVVTKVDEEARAATLVQIEEEKQTRIHDIERKYEHERKTILDQGSAELSRMEAGAERQRKEKEIKNSTDELERFQKDELARLQEVVSTAKKELLALAEGTIVPETTYQDLSLKYGHVFEAGIGAEALLGLLKRIDMEALSRSLEKELEDAAVSRKRKLLRRLKLFRSFLATGIRPESMILTVLPVIPPDLRPMVQLDGGRYASSDLNDLYRRVINRNNRLRKLLNLGAPEVIVRNEKRMLQEAVDSLIDNSARHGKTVTASTGQRRMLKSLADMLRGKQGRFRQNLLGKRTDYSGRSVIVVGPHLKMHQCGIPKRMALELFKPFVVSELIRREFVHNVRSANRFMESDRSEIWDILEEITRGYHVLLNRAPTLHRLGIQAFQPVLIEGKAIQVHPMVCSAFNADFDGDQMAVHVPLTREARWEAGNLMLASKNLLKPATGEPVATPNQDVVLGCFWMTRLNESVKGSRGHTMRAFESSDEAKLAYANGLVGLQDPVKAVCGKEILITSVGRILFNEVLPKDFPFVNEEMDKSGLKKLVARSLETSTVEDTAAFLDRLKDLAFIYLTRSGLSWGMDDLKVPQGKSKIIQEGDAHVDQIREHYETGLLTDDERHVKIIGVWTQAKDQITVASKDTLDKSGPVYAMVTSGARSSWAQITQMMGMKGPVANPSGEIIELPIKGSFKEGLDVLEYFISTHGARKGLSDTALRTANAGYLTRRLVDVAQEIVVVEEDCGDEEGSDVTAEESDFIGETLLRRLQGRVLAADLVDAKTKKVVLKKGTIVTPHELARIEHKGTFKSARIRSCLTCKTRRGVCQRCYGFDLAYHKPVQLGTAVGIIAAQSIGEPGTQLTMRTFHTGGVAGKDITQGLPRVEELFEVRSVKRKALLAPYSGTVTHIEDKGKARVMTLEEDSRPVPKKDHGKDSTSAAEPERQEFTIPPNETLLVKKGDQITKGQQLTDGTIDPYELFALRGKEAVERYIFREIQYIYFSQGQKLHDKHIEVIIRQLFSRLQVEDPGDSDLLPGEIVPRVQYLDAVETVKEKGGKVPVAVPLLLGITKVSLLTDSFLAAASFQETARVLIDAAVTGRVDYLRGLKENVIIGKLIPAGTGFPQGSGIPQDELVKAREPLRTLSSQPTSAAKEPQAAAAATT